MSVIYKPVVGHLGYRVGDDGSVWSCWKRVFKGYRSGHNFVLGDVWTRLKPNIVRRYYQVSLRRTDKSPYRKVHHLVLEAFVGLRPQGTEACHNNGNRLDNDLSNLRWGTKSENYQDRHKHGTTNDGVRNGRAKLTPEKVEVIRKRIADGDSPKVIAKDYKVTATAIRLIKTGRNWRRFP